MKNPCGCKDSHKQENPCVDPCFNPCVDPCAVDHTYMANYTDAEKQLIIQNLGLNNGLVEIVNFPDNEDLFEKDHMLKFADKEFDSSVWSGLGRVWLRKNIQEVNATNKCLKKCINLLTQEMINKANTIYIIQYDYDLNGNTIYIPNNCILWFFGGSISNGTLVFNNTLVYPNFFNIDKYINAKIIGNWGDGATKFENGFLLYWDGVNWQSLGSVKTEDGQVCEYKQLVYFGVSDRDNLSTTEDIQNLSGKFYLGVGQESPLFRLKGYEMPYCYIAYPSEFSNNGMRLYTDGTRNTDWTTLSYDGKIDGVEYTLQRLDTPQCGEVDLQIRYVKLTNFE